MDHVVYVDAKAKEMEILLSGKKTMIIRGATGRKLPYSRLAPFPIDKSEYGNMDDWLPVEDIESVRV